ncbi:transcriptional regulator [Verticiella sediminum]|uniref:Transcriptional regulator n=1 Tax=Verticiella sediminum TaxID=1247510 RepID=A0A556AZI9_9BURK|nr:transcriptional regulator [Verticiella sediminum]TSH98334.1 transcriptional regulator [Verticiella sediminum]
MNVKDLCREWAAFHQRYGIGGPILDESHYEQMLALAEQLAEDAARSGVEAAPGLLDVVADGIREDEDRVHPWPDTAAPADVLRALINEHGLNQSEVPEVGSQGVVSEILRGRRELNLRQVKALSERFHVAPTVFMS